MDTQLSKFRTAGVLSFATHPPLIAVSGKRVAPSAGWAAQFHRIRRPVIPKYTRPKPQAIARKNATNIIRSKKREPDIGIRPIITATPLPIDSAIFTILDHDNKKTAKLVSKINAPPISEETRWTVSLDLKKSRIFGMTASVLMNSRRNSKDSSHPNPKRIATMMPIPQSFRFLENATTAATRGKTMKTSETEEIIRTSFVFIVLLLN